MNDSVTKMSSNEGMAKIVYILYMVGLVVGITAIIGVVMAYINKDDSPEWLKSHYQFQIRTFWIGALYLILSVILMIVVIGFFAFLFWVIWLIVRCIKGFKTLDRKQAHPDPKGWLF